MAKGSGGKVAARTRQVSKKLRALTMVRKLHRDLEAVRRGRSLIMWCPVAVMVTRPADADVLDFAVLRGWIEVSPAGRYMRVTKEGREAVLGWARAQARQVGATQ